MAKNLLFMVHGIGQHKAGWIDEPDGPATALTQALALYPECVPAGTKISDLVDVVEIRYDDVFDLILDTWKDLGKAIPANAGFEWVDAVRNLMTSVDENTELFLRFGGDVLLYEGFELVARTVRLRVNAVLATKIFQAWSAAGGRAGNVPRIAVVAHSLGTAVAQDALFELANVTWGDELKALKAERPDLAPNPHLSDADRAAFEAVHAGAEANPDRPVPADLSALYLISNTIPLLRRAPGEYALLQKDGAFDCARVVNVNNEFDPVSRIGGGLKNPQPRGGWTNVTVRHLHSRNVHGFGHYLSHPAVHAPMFARLIDPGFSAACAQRAADLARQPQWQGLGGDLANLDDAARDALKNALLALVAGESTARSLRFAIEGLAKQVGAH